MLSSEDEDVGIRLFLPSHRVCCDYIEIYVRPTHFFYYKWCSRFESELDGSKNTIQSQGPPPACRWKVKHLEFHPGMTTWGVLHKYIHTHPTTSLCYDQRAPTAPTPTTRSVNAVTLLYGNGTGITTDAGITPTLRFEFGMGKFS